MEIYSSIRILYQLATRIKWYSETELITFVYKNYLRQFKYNDETFDKYSYPTAITCICQDMMLIYCCSFLDEYEREFTPSKFPKESERIINLKQIVLPAYKQIKSWTDLKTLRNNIIAHNHRKKGKSIFDFDDKTKYNIPTADREYTFLADLVILIAQNISYVFPEFTNKIDFTSTLYDHLEIASEKIETIGLLRQIEKEIEYNKTIALNN